jgi:hypothetical protein
MFHIFERLNTGGINLNPMEIRKCVYSGALFASLEKINTLDEWRRLIGQPRVDKRLRDAELLLRLLALSSSWENYKKPMKRFLNGYLVASRKLKDCNEESFIKETNDNFSALCSYTLQHLGEKPFHLRGRLNYAAMDSTLIASGLALKKGIIDLKSRYETLVKDTQYLDWCTKDTSDEKILISRIEKAIGILAG